MALFLQHPSLLSLPQLPQPTAVNTLQAHGEQLLFPGRVRSGPPRSATEPPWPGIPAWWAGREVGKGVWAQGDAETTLGPLCSALCGIFLPQSPACPPGESYRRSGPRKAPLISRGVFLVSDAWLFSQTVPNPCQQHFKLWPAQCYILTGQALLT